MDRGRAALRSGPIAAGLVVALSATGVAAAPAGLGRDSPFYRTAQFPAPPPESVAAPASDTRAPRPLLHRAVPQPLGGALPNQRTGPKREHPVRDICIGC
ncbi:hypothetical protein [Methylobacterium sp. A54F]